MELICLNWTNIIGESVSELIAGSFWLIVDWFCKKELIEWND